MERGRLPAHREIPVPRGLAFEGRDARDCVRPSRSSIVPQAMNEAKVAHESDVAGSGGAAQPDGPLGRRKDEERYLEDIWPDSLTRMSDEVAKLADLIGSKVHSWSNLPKGDAYEAVMDYEASIWARRLLVRHDLGNLEASVGTQLFFKNGETEGVTYATAWVIGTVKGKKPIAASVIYVLPEEGRFKPEAAVEGFDAYALREKWRAHHGDDRQWPAYMKLWQMNAVERVSQSPERFYRALENKLIPVETIDQIASRPIERIAKMTSAQKRRFGLLLLRRFASLHEYGHAAIQHLVETPELLERFLVAFKENPGLLTQNGILKAIGGRNAELMAYQALVETWCHKFALYLLRRDEALAAKRKEPADPETKEILTFFDGELSDAETRLFTEYYQRLAAKRDGILRFGLDSGIEGSVILKATQSQAAWHLPGRFLAPASAGSNLALCR
jgi:hypothetical protein